MAVVVGYLILMMAIIGVLVRQDIEGNKVSRELEELTERNLTHNMYNEYDLHEDLYGVPPYPYNNKQ